MISKEAVDIALNCMTAPAILISGCIIGLVMGRLSKSVTNIKEKAK